MNRPLINKSIDELEVYYRQNNNDPKALIILHNELKHRTTKRAKQLNIMVEKQIGPLEKALLHSVESQVKKAIVSPSNAEADEIRSIEVGGSLEGQTEVYEPKKLDKRQLSVFEKYQERLINLSGRNRSLVINTLHKKRAFDLALLGSHLPENYERLIEDLIFGDANSIELMPDPIKVEKSLNIAIKRIWQSYTTSASKDLNGIVNAFKPILGQWTMPLKDSQGKKYTIEQLETLVNNRVSNYIEELHGMSHSLRTLYREIEAERKENGLYNLKIGIHFAEGKFSDGSKCRAPLSFLPVELILKNNTWFIRKTNDGEIIANDVFMMSSSKYNHTQVSKESLLLTNVQTSSDEIIAYYEKLGVMIKSTYSGSKNISSLFVPFVKYTSKHFDLMSEGQLVHKNFLVLGDFPLSNAIFEDYSALISQDLTSDTIEVLFGKGSSSHSVDTEKISKYGERKFHYISELDYSQEIAILSGIESNNLVIFGPPGTGKSQTITNLIADNLAKGKRVLMVSQKRAALDVIYNRLSTIQDKTLLIHDAHTGKKEFYEKNLKVFEYFEDHYKLSQIRSANAVNFDVQNSIKDSLQSCAYRIDREIGRLNQLYEFLYTPLNDGYTGQDLLLNAQPSVSPDQVDFLKVRKLIKEFDSDDLNRLSIQALLNKQVESESAKIVHGLNNLTHQFPFLQHLRQDFSEYDSLDAIDSIKNMQEKFENFVELIKTEDFTNMNDAFITLADDKLVERFVCDNVEQERGNLKLPIAHGLSRLIKMLFQRKQLLQTEAENMAEFERHMGRALDGYRKLRDLRIDLSKAIDSLIEYFEDKEVQVIKAQAYCCQLEITSEMFESALPYFAKYKQLSGEYNTYSKTERAIIEKLLGAFDNPVTAQEMLIKFESFYCAVRLIELNTTELFKQYEATILKHKDLINDIQSEIVQKREWTKEYIRIRWDHEFLVSAKEKSTSELKRISGLKRKVRSIREAFKEHYHHLHTLYPCILLGPEMVSSVLPLAEGMFDLVIFDEASQMFVEEAIPSLFRGKSVVVAGDDKQLRPNSAFKSRLVLDDTSSEDDSFDQEETDNELLVGAALEEESLLDLAKVTFYPTNLMFHYRSEYEELINFSNHAFYGGRLRTVPNQHDMSMNPPIKRILVSNGTWLNRQNIEEATQVVNLIKKILLERKDNASIGVITFNVNQKDLIEDLLEVEGNRDAQFNKLLLDESNRVVNNEDVSLFVKNIENVQGDERDIIIFSTGYAKDEQGRLVAHFGSLSQDGGENRLNVAISRAKKQIYLVTSFEPEALNVEQSKNLGPKLFKKYLQYVRLVSQGLLIDANQFLKTLSGHITEKDSPQFDSPFEMEVYDELRAMGYNVKTQIGTSAYKIDLVIYDESSSRYVLGIECDGAAYHSSKSAKENDVYRQRFLESRGWKIYRIWSLNWWKHKHQVLKELQLIISTELKKNVRYTESISISDKITVEKTVEKPTLKLPDPPKPPTANQGEKRILQNIVGFGNRVLINDSEGEEYEVYLESNPLNKGLMNPFHLFIMGKAVNETFTFNGNEYTIVSVD